MRTTLPYTTGKILGQRYRIDSLLKRSFAAVHYQAKDITLGRDVIVKHLRIPSGESGYVEWFRERFTAEAQLLRKISHRAIPRLYDLLQIENEMYQVLEYVDGISLEQLLAEKKRVPLDEVLEISKQLLEILVYLHKLDPPVILQALHPSHLVLKNGQLGLSDFFMAHTGRDEPKEDLIGVHFPGYSPPRWFSDNSPPIITDDLYTAGVIIHRMLTGSHPASRLPGTIPGFPDEMESEVPGYVTSLVERAFKSGMNDAFFSTVQFHTQLSRARNINEEAYLCSSCGRANPTGTLFCSFCSSPSQANDGEGSRKKSFPLDFKRPKFPLKKLEINGDALLYPISLMVSRPLGFDNLLTIDHNHIDEFPHQIRAVKRALKNMGGRCLLADEVGLGKTIEAGIIMEELLVRGLVKSILVVVPAHLRFQWKEELKEKFGEEFKIYTSPKSINPERDNRIIISYDAVSRRGATRETFLNRKWDLLIVDEAHHARNNKTLRWKFLNEVKNDYILLLTATPVQNQLADLFNLVTLLRPGHLSNIKQFRKDFISSGDPRKVKNPELLRKLLSGIMIRTRRADAMITFPRRIAATRVVQLTVHERELYDEVLDFIRELAGKGDERFSLGLMHIAQRLTSSPAAATLTLQKLSRNDRLFSREEQGRWHQYYMLASDIVEPAKVSETLRILSQVNDRTVLFTDQLPTQDYLASYFTSLKIPTSVYRGDIRQKVESLEYFKREGQVLIVSQSGGEGLNLQHMSNVLINYDLPWNPMRLEQRIGRLQRLGQVRDVYVFNLAGENTVESHILRVLEEKIRMFQLSVGQLDLILGTRFEEEGSFEQLVWKKLISAAGRDRIGEEILSIGDELQGDLESFEKIRESDDVLNDLATDLREDIISF